MHLLKGIYTFIQQGLVKDWSLNWSKVTVKICIL